MRIFSIENDGITKIITIMGLKIKIKPTKKLLNLIYNKVNLINTTLNDNSNFFNISKERALDSMFIEYISKDFKQDYLDLIKNLDLESIELIQTIVKGIQNTVDNGTSCIKMSKNEIMHIKNFNFFLERRVIKLGDVYAYKNYLLPLNEFYDTIFYNNCGMDYCNIDKNKTIIDAGAWIGDSSIVLAKYTNDKVYAFEPVAETYKLLTKTIKINSLENKIIPIQKGLSNVNSSIEINLTNASSNSTLIGFNKTDDATKVINKETIEICKLDDFVKENNLQVGCIKADVEGAEKMLLEGAFETIKTQKPVLIISIYHSPEDFFKIKPLVESWDLGYSFKIRRLRLVNYISDTVLICECKN